LKKMTAGGAAALVAKAAAAQTRPPQQIAMAPPPPAVDASADEERNLLTTERPGSDFMVDVLKTLNFEFIAANPGSSFRALQESIVNYGGNKNPEFITCMHEEASVAM